ncbi:hypothetical protein KP509_28G012700 [Ceratopteris richardii]|uniref:Uncharacterized protein n=1 Tax=Ceratopteris richardii TaxID=49495 RepID=A0A8T2R9K9_CERRI|nr:hypothetical protein KP509_28G012700 [Ceratopteris richardii]
MAEEDALESQTVTERDSPSSIGVITHMSTLGFLPSVPALISDKATVHGEVDHRCLLSIMGDRGSHITSLAVLGDYLYAGIGMTNAVGVSSDCIRVWHKTTLKESVGLGAGYASVKALIVGGDRILSAHQDHKIRIWSKVRKPSITISPGLKQVSDSDCQARQDALRRDDIKHELLICMPTVKDYIKSYIAPRNYVEVRRHCKRLWIEHVDAISMLAIGGSTDDPILYSASWDRTIKVWKLSGWKCVESFRAHDDAINALLVGPDGFLYTASSDTKVKEWERSGTSDKDGQQFMHNGKATDKKHVLVSILEAHKAPVNTLSLIKGTNDKDFSLYSAGCDKGIVVWEREGCTKQMVARHVLRGHLKAVLCLARTGNILCSGSADRTIRIWQRTVRETGGGSSHCCVAVLHGHSGPVRCLALSSTVEDDCLLYSSSLDNQLKVWKLSDLTKDEKGNSARMQPVASLVALRRFSSI